MGKKTVKECMKVPVVYVSIESNLGEAKNLMKEKNVKRLPVLKDGKLVGIIVSHDIERALASPGYYINVPVEWVMTKEVMTVDVEDDILKAAENLVNFNITALPVMSGEELVGIISAKHIIREYIELRGE